MIKNQIAGLMRQAQQVQDNIKKAQEDLANVTIEGVSGGGLIRILMTCRYTVKKITIDPSLLMDDKDLLEDLLVAASNDALRKIESTSKEKMSSMTGGLTLPIDMKFPA